ncbi:actin cortical patch SUR7/pH-response regulator pali [Limtongia smithiae]|uniref:actin cortical patch SUR7/pH-response regulator pali n=1 Tax=Limtongia smithiae TaxID=1125753 RepID=UPI0034CEBEFC
MAAGRNCFIISFPYFFVVASFVLTIFVLIGSILDKSIYTKLYFMRIDVSGLSVSIDDTTVTYSEVSSDIPGFYQVGVWNYCKGSVNSTTGSGYTIDSCVKPSGLFYFNPVTVIEDAIDEGDIDNVPSSLTSALKAAKAISYAMTILFCVSVIFSVMSFIAGFFSFHSRAGSFCTLIISMFTLASSVAAAGLATGLYVVEVKAINNADFGITATTGRVMFGIVWAAAAASIISAFFWFISICVGSTRRSVSEKVVYEPVAPSII